MNLADIIGNEESRLARFPVAREKVFLSHAAVTALPHCAAQAMADYAYSSCKDHQEFPEFMETMNETRRLSANLIGAEFSEIAHTRGILSAARSADPNSANSQFFICFDSAPHLDRQYSAFGKVIKGMEFVDMIKKGDPNSGSVADPDKIITLRSK